MMSALDAAIAAARRREQERELARLHAEEESRLQRLAELRKKIEAVIVEFRQMVLGLFGGEIGALLEPTFGVHPDNDTVGVMVFRLHDQVFQVMRSTSDRRRFFVTNLVVQAKFEIDDALPDLNRDHLLLAIDRVLAHKPALSSTSEPEA